MPTIQIDALDTLFFRDSKTFTKGEDTWADTMFPPYPSVIYGALRSAYFAENIEELGKANVTDKTDPKENDPTKDLVIKRIYLKLSNSFSQNNCYYYPVPLDCIKDKNDTENNVFVLTMKENENNNNCKANYILKTDKTDEVENIDKGLFEVSQLQNYLSSPTNFNQTIEKLSKYTELEPKIGIARSKHTRTSDEGLLYRVGMTRLSNKNNINESLSLIVDFDFKDETKNQLLKKGLMKMGGESKAVKYKIDGTPFSINQPEIKNSKFKLYLSTPAIFKNGWLPGDIDKNTLEGTINDVKVKLITASIGKPVSIGGWDIKRGCPKVMRKAVPEGSVYYFELTNPEDIDKLLNNCHGKSISDFNSQEGFGIAYVGAVQ